MAALLPGNEQYDVRMGPEPVREAILLDHRDHRKLLWKAGIFSVSRAF
jgi:hypothetical protein